MHPLAGTIIVALGVLFAVFLIRDVVRRSISRARLLEADERDEPRAVEPVEAEERGPLGRWLALAGYRAPGAAPGFVGLTVASVALGAVLVLLLWSSGIIEMGLAELRRIPGAIGEILWAPMVLGPWFILVVFAGIPCLVVRSSR